MTTRSKAKPALRKAAAKKVAPRRPDRALRDRALELAISVSGVEHRFESANYGSLGGGMGKMFSNPRHAPASEIVKTAAVFLDFLADA
jgi:hypothetical protein